jgi:hypothetical protein
MYQSKKDLELKASIAKKTDRELSELNVFLLQKNETKLGDIESYLRFFVILTLLSIGFAIFKVMI